MQVREEGFDAVADWCDSPRLSRYCSGEERHWQQDPPHPQSSRSLSLSLSLSFLSLCLSLDLLLLFSGYVDCVCLFNRTCAGYSGGSLPFDKEGSVD